MRGFHLIPNPGADTIFDWTGGNSLKTFTVLAENLLTKMETMPRNQPNHKLSLSSK